MEKYFIRYNEQADIDYRNLLLLYNEAKFNKEERVYNIIQYESYSKLAKQISAKYPKVKDKNGNDKDVISAATI
jgi:N-acetyl-anhydromuramyl-L-alanine amidase AmpD